MREDQFIQKDSPVKTNTDEILALQLGTCMRLSLNAAALFATGSYLIFLWKMETFTALELLVAIAPASIAMLFFLLFLRLIKRVERYAEEKRDIDLVSKVIWEFNKSSLIRLAIGRIASFIEKH